MSNLVELMEKCEADTKELINAGAAVRLANWRKYSDNEVLLVQYIQRVIRSNRSNGWKLESRDGLSLERIVIDHCPELFTEEDVGVAKVNLGLSK